MEKDIRNNVFHHVFSGAIIFFMLLSSNPVKAQDREVAKDYQQIFGRDYHYAVNIIARNGWWSDTLQSHSSDPAFALSVVFPELIRYSSILDYIEVKGLEVLYVQYGGDYADFSIGYFQMKPSFAEKIEADILGLHLTGSNPHLSALYPDTTHSREARKARIIRLKDEYSQLLYLEAFIIVMDEMFPDISSKPDIEKLAFYSTAYNTGYYKGERAILEQMNKDHFYCGLVPGTERYSYAEISIGFYLEIRER